MRAMILTIGLLFSVALTVALFASGALTVALFASGYVSLDPTVIREATVQPSSHALYGTVARLDGGATYCINAETVSRGEPVSIGVYYRRPVPIPADRFGSTEYRQDGQVFTTDNDKVVNETVSIPGDAVDGIVTVSYQNYVSDNKVHIKIRRCNPT